MLDVARAALLIDGEARSALARASNETWVLDEAALTPSDPREAASAAAWRALSGRAAGGAPQRSVSFVAPSEGSESSSAELEREIEKAAQSWTRSSIEQKSRLENGQGELWALLASPCGTSGESESDAGAQALVIRTIQARYPQLGGVSIEPWVTADGVGLLAHAPRLSPREAPAELARRMGDALGRAFATSRITGAQAAQAREDLLEELGPGPRPGLGVALDAVSGGHPSWLDPRGLSSSLVALEIHVLESRRRALLQAPLRLAVLSNTSSDQSAKVAAGIEEWLRPLRSTVTSCPTAKKSPARTGEITLEPTDDEARPAAYVALALPTQSTGGVRREAEWTAYLLNRDGGYLSAALPGSASGRAAVLGGKHAGGLVIEISTTDDPAPVVGAVRALLDRLSKGGATQADLDVARRRFAEIDAQAALDPRWRLVSLWTDSKPRAPDLSQLRRFHQWLGSEHHLVVYVRPK